MSEAFLQGMTKQHAAQQLQRQSSPRQVPVRRQMRGPPPPPTELQWDAPPGSSGRAHPAARRPPLTHRERVRRMLQSNDRMKSAHAAVEVGFVFGHRK